MNRPSIHNRYRRAFENFEGVAASLRGRRHEVFGDGGLPRVVELFAGLKSRFDAGNCDESVQREFSWAWNHVCACREMQADCYEPEVALEFWKYIALIFAETRAAAEQAGQVDTLELLKYVQVYLDCGIVTARRAIVRPETLKDCRIHQANITILFACIMRDYLHAAAQTQPNWIDYLANVFVLLEGIRYIVVHGIPADEMTINEPSTDALLLDMNIFKAGVLADLRNGVLINRKLIMLYKIVDYIGLTAAFGKAVS